MSNVHRINDGGLYGAAPPKPAPLDGGGEPPHDGPMESRVATLEALIPTLATKADVSELRADISKDVGDLRSDMHKGQSEVKGWFIATAVLVLVGMFTIANVMMTNVRAAAATPQAATMGAPIIIQVPTPSAPAQPAAPPPK